MKIVVRKIGKKSERGPEMRMGWRSMLELAHGSVRNTSSLSSNYQVSRRTVSRVRIFVAYAEHEWQGAKLKYIQGMLDAQGLGCPAATCWVEGSVGR